MPRYSYRYRRRVGLSALVVASWAAAAVALVYAAPSPSERRAPQGQVAAPSRAALDAALTQASRFVTALYRPLPGGRAVMSEYLALPLRVYFPRTKRWVLLGANEESHVSNPVTRFDRESEEATIAPRGTDGSLRLLAEVNWNRPPGRYVVRVKVRSLGAALGPAEIYLGDVRLGRAMPAADGQTFARSFRHRDRAPLRSFRWTVRHGAQLGHNFFLSRGDRARAEPLSRLMHDLGFAVDYDLTAPIFERGQAYSDDMPYDFDPAGRSAYHDCDIDMPSTTRSYPYVSKVCSVSRPGYVWSTRTDTLVPAVHAIHILNRHGDGDRAYRDAPVGVGDGLSLTPLRHRTPTRTPRATAAQLEGKFRKLRFGMPRCTPADCDGWASGVRTFQFGALQALLGYRHGDPISRAYSDRVARIALAVQVPESGLVSRADAGPLLRPAAAGSFYVAWDRRLRLASTAGAISKLSDSFNMPPEYRGAIASNSETSLTAYAFLSLYRCLRFGAGGGAPRVAPCAVRNRLPIAGTPVSGPQAP